MSYVFFFLFVWRLLSHHTRPKLFCFLLINSFSLKKKKPRKEAFLRFCRLQASSFTHAALNFSSFFSYVDFNFFFSFLLNLRVRVRAALLWFLHGAQEKHLFFFYRGSPTSHPPSSLLPTSLIFVCTCRFSLQAVFFFSFLSSFFFFLLPWSSIQPIVSLSS